MGVVHRCTRILGVTLAAGLWFAVVSTAQAAGDTVDQSNTVATGANSLKTPMAQTFTAGSSSQVDRVSVMLSTNLTPMTVTVQLQGVTAQKPNGSVLGSKTSTVTVACCHQWQDFTFSPAVAVTQGVQYAIVVKSNLAVTWYDSFSFDSYTRGQLWLMVGSTWSWSSSFGRDFDFQTWVTGSGANRPPVVTGANTIVSAPEGAPGGVTNSGTYSDPDGNNVSLSASFGSLTKSGSSSGTWTWSAPAPDEQAAQTVTVTANDGQGGTASFAFSYSVAPVPPTVTITGASASAPEGTALTLTGTVTSPSASDNAAGFTLTWTVTKNGNPYATGTGSSISVTPDDEGAFAATLQAVDDGGNSATAAVTFSGGNVSPSAVISSVTHASIVLVPLQTVDFAGGYTDPGKLDTETGVWDYGDHTATDTYAFAAGGAGESSEEHAYAAPGTYTVTYAVTDDDGGTGTATVSVVVETPAAALGTIDSYVQTMQSLNTGQKNGLSAKLRAAEASLARGDSTATCNQLDAFMDDLLALTNSGSLSATDSAALSSSTWAVHRALGCTKVKVGWLTLSL
jgi:PKD domain-containing protein/Big-like domain-containing protein